MYHLHIYLHRWTPFLNLNVFEDGESEQYRKYISIYKGREMYVFPDCKVCQKQTKQKFDWIKYPYTPPVDPSLVLDSALLLDPALAPSLDP